MQQVDIYLYPSSRAPKLKEGSYYWKARCRGVPREGTGQAGECTSGQRLVLMCAAAALKIVIRPAMITIHTPSNTSWNGQCRRKRKYRREVYVV